MNDAAVAQQLRDMRQFARDAIELLGDADAAALAGDKMRQYAVTRALELVEEDAFDRADVIAISDGLAAISPATVARWNRARTTRGMRAYAVLIGTAGNPPGGGAGTLASIADALLTMSDLEADQEVLDTLFGV